MHIQQYGARTVIGCTDKNDQTVLHYAACVGNVLVRITTVPCLFCFYTLLSLFNWFILKNSVALNFPNLLDCWRSLQHLPLSL